MDEAKGQPTVVWREVTDDDWGALPVGTHHTRLLYDGEFFPVTLTVRDDGSVLVRSDPYLGPEDD